MKGCGELKVCGFWGKRICGRFEDLEHSDHYIYCLDCIKKEVQKKEDAEDIKEEKEKKG